MTIYRLSYDNEKYPSIDINPDEDEDKLPEGINSLTPNIEKSSYWVSLNGTYYYGEDAPKNTKCPDIADWCSSIVLSETAKEKIGNELLKYGELLPIIVEGEKRYYFNLLNSTDAIDPFNTKRKEIDGIDFGIEKIAFLEHEVENICIFNTEYDGYSYLYCTDEFITLIDQSGLTSGWEFCEELRE